MDDVGLEQIDVANYFLEILTPRALPGVGWGCGSLRLDGEDEAADAECGLNLPGAIGADGKSDALRDCEVGALDGGADQEGNIAAIGDGHALDGVDCVKEVVVRAGAGCGQKSCGGMLDRNRVVGVVTNNVDGEETTTFEY